jgi:hypothetical protein
LEIAEKRNAVLGLRKAGATYSSIGKSLGISKQHAHRIVVEELKRLSTKRSKTTEEVARLELERLDTMLMGVWQEATKGDVPAIGAVLKIMERRAKLLGLDAPTEHRAELKVSKPDDTSTITERISQYMVELDNMDAGPNALRGDPPGNGTGKPLDSAPTDDQTSALPDLRSP